MGCLENGAFKPCFLAENSAERQILRLERQDGAQFGELSLLMVAMDVRLSHTLWVICDFILTTATSLSWYVGQPERGMEGYPHYHHSAITWWF